MKFFLQFTVFFIMSATYSTSQTLRIEPTIHSAGFYLEGINGISNKTSASVKFKGKDQIWREALTPSLVSIFGNKTYAGSILMLEANSEYTISFSLIDSLPVPQTYTYSSSFSTNKNPQLIYDIEALYVSPNGSDKLYTKDFPGNISQLFSLDIDKLKCGTKIICKGGDYNVGNLKLDFSKIDCSDNNPLFIIEANQDEVVTFDGSETNQDAQYPNWVLIDAQNSIYKADLPSTASWSTLCLFDSLRLFPYFSVYPKQILFFNYRECLSNATEYFGSGFYRIGNQYYIRLSDGQNPNGHKITVSKYHNLFTFTNPDTSVHPKMILRNLVIKNYSSPLIQTNYNPFTGNYDITGDYAANAVNFDKIQNTIIDHCQFAYNTYSLTFGGNCSNTIIQNSTFKDQTGLWQHGAFKNTALTITGDLNLLPDNGKYGRTVEASSVFFDQQNQELKNIIVQNNQFNGTVSAIGGRAYENYPAFNIDINDNIFTNHYDAIDAIGNVVNERIWKNTVRHNPVSISLITYPVGPVYIFRNVFDQITSRKNPSNKPDSFNPELYVNYNGCEGVKPLTWGTMLKMNTGAPVNNPRTDIHFYHNTVSIKDSFGFAFYLSTPNWRSIKSANNIFSSKRNPLQFDGISGLSNFAFLSMNENYYTNNGDFLISIGQHGNKNTCSNYDDFQEASLGLRNLTNNLDSTQLNFNKCFDDYPDFLSEQSGEYQLNNSSKLINNGIKISNISDLKDLNYFGMAPDIGAFEYLTTKAYDSNVNAENNLKLWPNPSSTGLRVSANKDLTQIEINSLTGSRVYKYVLQNISNSFEIPKLEIPTGFYIIKACMIDGTIASLKFVFQK